MKNVRTLLTILLMPFSLLAQQNSEVIDLKKHKIIMQFSAGDSLSQVSVLGQVKNIRTAWPNAQLEVVCHGNGLDLLVANKSKAGDQVKAWTNQGVVFAACNNTMKRKGVTANDLLPQVTVVPSAMTELVSKQEKKWAYVRGGH